MKRLLLAVCTTALLTTTTSAQEQPYNVVFDITSSDTTMHQSLLRWINLILSTHPNAQLQVVFYGQSLNMITQNGSAATEATVRNFLTGKQNVSFTVCGAAMKRHRIEASRLLPGVHIVPDGIYEIVKKQKEGWGYIKVAN